MPNKPAVLLSAIADEWGLTHQGPDCTITGVAAVGSATPSSISYIRDASLLDDAKRSDAGALVVSPDVAKQLQGRPLLIAEDPYLAFIRIAARFAEPPAVAGNRNHAFVHPDAEIAETAVIGDGCTVEAGCHIGARVRLYPGVRIMANCRIGEDTSVYPNTVVFPGCRIGARCLIGANSVIGGEGFGFHFAEGRHHKVPQTGIVVIGDDVEIGNCVTIDRGTFGETRIGNGTKIDNQVQIAHNVTIGQHVVIVAQAGISGSTEIGDYAVLAGKAGVVGHIRIGKGATIGGASVVTKSVPDGAFVTGYPAIEHRQWKRVMVHLNRLPELAGQIRNLIKNKKTE